MPETRADPDWSELLARHEVAELTAASGGATWHLVGGVLRDTWLGRPAPDLDIVVESQGEAFANRAAEQLGARLVALGGERFAAYRLVRDGLQVDVWDRQGGDLRADLERRDFTVNSMALEPTTVVLHDPFHGLRDLASGTLRATTQRSFAEDPVRVLRLVRFAADLGLRVAPATLEEARRQSHRLLGDAGPAVERLREELGQILRGPAVPAAVELLAEVDAFPRLWGPSRTRGASAAAAVARADRRLRLLADAGFEVGDGERYALFQAVLFAYGAEDPAAAPLLATAARRAGLLSRRETDAIRHLLSPRARPRTEAERRWFLHSAGAPWPAALALLEITAAGEEDWESSARRLAALAHAEGAAIFDPSPLLDGHRLRHLGVTPGPELGAILTALRRAQVEGRIATQAEAEALVAELQAARS